MGEGTVGGVTERDDGVDNDGYRFATVEQLRIVALLQTVLGEMLGIRWLANGERCRDGSFRFGHDEDVPGAPFLTLDPWGHIGGGTYDGDIESLDRYELVGAVRDGSPLHLLLDDETSSLGGRDPQLRSTTLPADELAAVSAELFRRWREGLPAPVDATWMLSARDRAALAATTVDRGNLDRFSGFADLYDAHRPSAPSRLGGLLAAYANVARPAVVDIGSGTGLSTRWIAGWADHVIGIEPNDDMRAQAEQRAVPRASYGAGTGQATGLPDASADVVTVVQAMHWMDPVPTLAEIARVLRPGGVLAVIDADWPPVTGIPDAEFAWVVAHRRIRVLEARLAGGASAEVLRRPIVDDDPALADDDLRDPHRNRVMPGGGRSWSKREHLDRMRGSGHFTFTRELVLDGDAAVDEAAGGVDLAERFVGLMRSQGSYQALRSAGLTDDDIGVTDFDREVRAAYASTASPPPITFGWRVQLGIRA